MINIRHSSGKVAYGVQDFVLDTYEDLQNLDNECAPGSTAFIIATSEKYMLNSHNAWVQIKGNGGGGGGGDEPNPDDIYIYDGGTIV